MKTLRVSLVVFSLFLFSSAFGLINSGDDEAVKQVIGNYSKGIDSRNADVLQDAIYPSAHFLSFNKLTNKITETTNEQLIDLVKKGKAGGWARELNINSVDVNENTAMAKVVMSDAKVKQTGFITLIKDNGSWKITSGAYTLESLK
jgi:hypothetical protein